MAASLQTDWRRSGFLISRLAVLPAKTHTKGGKSARLQAGIPVALVFDGRKRYANGRTKSNPSHWPFQLIRSEGVLVHEIGHVFRNGFTLTASWEEGMVRAMEVEVHRRLGWPHWDASHSYYLDVWYEMFNEPDIGGEFYGGPLLLRYQVAGYAWTKVFLEAEDFFREFNTRLYANPSLLDKVTRLIALAASIVPVVEGESFAAWYQRQYIFSPVAPIGLRLLNRLDAVAVFYRDEAMRETFIPDVMVHWEVFDYQWNLLTAGEAVSGDNYAPYAPFYIDRGAVILETPDATSDTSFRYYGTGLYEGDWGLFGVNQGHDSGAVVVTNLHDSTTTSAGVANGAFSIPELGSVRGRFRIRLTAEDGRYWIRYFNKDASSYFVLVDGPIIRSTQVAEIPPSAPRGFYLAQNYPNPFNPITTIIFDIPEKSRATLSVYNLTGQKVAVLVDGDVEVGQHRVSWNATNQPSGVYFYRIESGSFQAMKKMILVK